MTCEVTIRPCPSFCCTGEHARTTKRKVCWLPFQQGRTDSAKALGCVLTEIELPNSFLLDL